MYFKLKHRCVPEYQPGYVFTYLSMYIYIPFSEIGYVKVIYLIKRFVKHPQKESYHLEHNQGNVINSFVNHHNSLEPSTCIEGN